jgi:hypothetical protein
MSQLLKNFVAGTEDASDVNGINSIVVYQP